MKRLAILISIAALSGLTVAAPVLADAPANDDIDYARVVGSLPYSDGPYDTTEATTGANDPFCYNSVPDASTVWYSFTPAADDRYLADTFGSNYDTTLYVGTPNGSGGIDLIDCNGSHSAVDWDATAGTTYLIAVGTCCGEGTVGEAGGGGSLEFHVGVAPPPPTIDITVNASGSFTKAGTAIIRGAIACSGDLPDLDLFLEVMQRVGRFTTWSFGYLPDVSCSTSPTPWSIEVYNYNTKFTGGAVQVYASTYGCNARRKCAIGNASQTVHLRH